MGGLHLKTCKPKKGNTHLRERCQPERDNIRRRNEKCKSEKGVRIWQDRDIKGGTRNTNCKDENWKAVGEISRTNRKTKTP